MIVSLVLQVQIKFIILNISFGAFQPTPYGKRDRKGDVLLTSAQKSVKEFVEDFKPLNFITTSTIFLRQQSHLWETFLSDLSWLRSQQTLRLRPWFALLMFIRSWAFIFRGKNSLFRSLFVNIVFSLKSEVFFITTYIGRLPYFLNSYFDVAILH